MEGEGGKWLKRFLSFFIYVSLMAGMFFCVTCITNCLLLEKEEVVEVYTGSISPHEQWGRCESSPLLVWGLPSAMLTLFPGRPARTATSLLSNLLTVTRTPDWPRAWGLHEGQGTWAPHRCPHPGAPLTAVTLGTVSFAQLQPCWDMLGTKILQSQLCHSSISGLHHEGLGVSFLHSTQPVVCFTIDA